MAFFMQNRLMSTKCRALNVDFVELFLTFLQSWSILQIPYSFYLTDVCCAVVWPISSQKRTREDLKFGLHKEDDDDTGTAFCMQNLCIQCRALALGFVWLPSPSSHFSSVGQFFKYMLPDLSIDPHHHKRGLVSPWIWIAQDMMMMMKILHAASVYVYKCCAFNLGFVRSGTDLHKQNLRTDWQPWLLREVRRRPDCVVFLVPRPARITLVHRIAECGG